MVSLDSSLPSSKTSHSTGKSGISQFLRLDLLFGLITLLVLLVIANLKMFRLFSRTQISTIWDFLSQRFFPPDFSPVIRANIEYALWETIQMSLVATYFGVLMSTPLAILASRNLMPSRISIPFRLLLAGLRTVPSLIWALLFVILFGLGPRSGVIALAFYTVGYLGKLQFETFEGLNSDAIEAMSALGASKLQIIRFVALPEASNQLLSQIIFMFEYNIRAGSIIGFVGAGGIGFLLSFYMQNFQFKPMVTALIYLLVTIIVIDFLSGFIRKKFYDPNFKELEI